MKKWNVVASCLLGIGTVMMIGSLAACKGVQNLSAAKYTTETYEITENIQNISIETITADVKILPASDGVNKVVSFEREKIKQTVSLSAGTLVIGAEDTREWYDHINFFAWEKPVLTVYLAQTELNSLAIQGSTGDVTIAKEFSFDSIDVSISTGDVDCYASASGLMKIKTSTGDISVKNVAVGALDLTLSTGDVEVESVVCEGDVQINLSTGDTEIDNLTCKNFSSTGDTGELEMNKVVAAETMNIKRTTGDIRFKYCDAAEVTIKASTGDVKGTFLSEKIYEVSTSTGKKIVPYSETGGKCKITTTTGDIEIR